jgi:hypothetical protein
MGKEKKRYVPPMIERIEPDEMEHLTVKTSSDCDCNCQCSTACGIRGSLPWHWGLRR